MSASPPTPSSRLLARLLQHLLQRNSWALERLQPFAGRHARLAFGPFSVLLRVSSDGELVAAEQTASADVELSLPSAALARLPEGPAALLREVRIAGDAHFAETLGFVLRQLEWEGEEDLARWLGDPLAHRVHGSAQNLIAWGADSSRRMLATLREYAIDEAGLSPAPAEQERFSREVRELRDAIARLDKRIERLGG